MPTKPIYKVLVKYTKDKDVTMMFFDEVVELHYNFISGSITADSEDGKCLFITHYGLVDYIQVAADDTEMPLFMNVSDDKSDHRTCHGCVYRGSVVKGLMCTRPDPCEIDSSGRLLGYTAVSKEEK